MMNFLAHIYLSGDNPQVILGNFFADSIKGRKYKDYPRDVQKGILLHRAIDYFTDTHPIVRLSTARLFDNYSHYSGVIVDMYYDHFLAANWDLYSEVPLKEFTQYFYQLLKDHYDLLPRNVQNFMPYMIEHNWLLSYATIEGIGKILAQMSSRTKFQSRMELATRDLEEHYELFQIEFTSYFEELQMFARNKLFSL